MKYNENRGWHRPPPKRRAHNKLTEAKQKRIRQHWKSMSSSTSRDQIIDGKQIRVVTVTFAYAYRMYVSLYQKGKSEFWVSKTAYMKYKPSWV
ncbi:MAG: hypothetical protein H0U27_09015 [Nitrosopumilus sp.]|nr:hypothetical protein [Nitrosopumilus sp.]